MLKTPNLTNDEIEEITNNIITFTQNALESSRRIAHNLLPPVLEKFGLNAGIEELVEEYNSTKKVKVVFENTINFDSSNIDKHLHVFRILQELLGNIVKYSKANKVEISISKTNDSVLFVVKDNGIGFETQNIEIHGHGIAGIRHRTQMFSGSLTLTSAPASGAPSPVTEPRTDEVVSWAWAGAAMTVASESAAALAAR